MHERTQKMETAVYIGCGTDVAPLLALQDRIKKFVLVESQPESEFGHIKAKGYERPHFFSLMRHALHTAGFSFSRQRSDRNWVFVNRASSSIVSLWINSAFPFRNPPSMLLDEIGQACTLIVCGHLPHHSIVHLMRWPRTFVTNTATVLDVQEENEDAVDPSQFLSWTLLTLPPDWWCKTWHADESPRIQDSWKLSRFLRQHSQGMEERRKHELQ